MAAPIAVVLRRLAEHALAAGIALVATPASALITTVHPADALLAPGQWSGVGQLFEQRGAQQRSGCTATLLRSGRHVLTAAHCLAAPSAEVRFETAAAPVVARVTERNLHPNAEGNDLAVLELDRVVDASVERHDIYRARDEVGREFFKAAYGSVGTGETGQTGVDNLKRGGGNRFEADFARFLAQAGLTEVGASYAPFAEGPLAFVPEAYLMFDFDDGNAAGDAFGLHFGWHDRGLGAREINTGQRDSGSPAFLDGRIAGVTSFGFSDLGVFGGGQVADRLTFEVTSLDEVRAELGDALFDVFDQFFDDIGIVDRLGAFNNLLSTDSSFGEFAAEARVSVAADWIDGIVGRPLPEPGSAALALLGLVLALRPWRGTRPGRRTAAEGMPPEAADPMPRPRGAGRWIGRHCG